MNRPSSTGQRRTPAGTAKAAHARRTTPERPAIDPRLRTRRVGVAREQGRHRLQLILIALAVPALALTVLVVLHSSLFSARTVRVLGAHETSVATILRTTGLDHHPALVSVNPGADAVALDRLPWVSSATVRRSWPSTVVVTVTERQVIAAIAAGKGRFALVDHTGRVLAFASHPPSGVVTAEALGPIPAPGSTVGPGEKEVLVVAGAVPVSIEHDITSIGYSRADGLTLRLRQGPLVELATTADLRQKMVSLATLLAPERKVSLSGIVTVDLRVPAEPVLTP